jgi:hypothetical protein
LEFPETWGRHVANKQRDPSRSLYISQAWWPRQMIVTQQFRGHQLPTRVTVECSPASVIWGSLHAMIGPLSPTTGSFASNDCKTDTSYLRTLIRFMWDTVLDGIWGSNIEVQRTASIRGFTDLHAIDHWTNKWLRAFYSNSSDNQRPNVFAKFSKL